MKKVILLTPLLFLGSNAMNQEVQPCQTGSITTIPAYLFANPNPGDLRTWDSEKLGRLREQAGKATKKAINHHFPDAQAAAEHATTFD